MARLPLVPLHTSPELDAVYGEIAAARGKLLNVFQSLGHAPEGLRRMARVGQYLRFEAGLPPRLRELATQATAGVNRSQYEWTQHVPLARAAGVTDAEMGALAASRMPGGLSVAEQAAVAYAQELAGRRAVTDATFAELRRHFEPRVVTDLTILVAFYTALGMCLQALEVELDPGLTPLLP